VEPKSVELPQLKYDFSHSLIESIEVGPRREATFSIAILEWHGHRGQYAYTVRARFGGIENVAEVAAFFGDPPADRELRRLGYSLEKESRPGQLVLVMERERDDRTLEIRCSSFQVSGPRD
jgi:hypothetical protein